MISTDLFTSVINSYLPEPHASLLNGIIYGINLKTSPAFYNELKRVGLLHIVVLSGMNITIIGSIIGSITSFFSKRVSVLITILIIILFILFVHPQAPVIRAGIMGILTLVSIVFKRKALALYLLFLSGILSLALIPLINIWYPKWFQPLSFFLSYGATLGIILFGQTKNPPTKSSFSQFFYGIKKEIKLSLSAQLFTTPLIFLYFKQASLISPVANILISPFIAPLMIFGFLASFLGKIHFVLGLFPGLVCYAVLTLMIFIIETLSKLPFIFIQF